MHGSCYHARTPQSLIHAFSQIFSYFHSHILSDIHHLTNTFSYTTLTLTIPFYTQSSHAHSHTFTLLHTCTLIFLYALLYTHSHTFYYTYICQQTLKYILSSFLNVYFFNAFICERESAQAGGAVTGGAGEADSPLSPDPHWGLNPGTSRS